MNRDILNISVIYETCQIGGIYPFPYSEHLQANVKFVTITKQLNNKIGETFCEGLKWICNHPEKDGQQDY